MSARVERAFHHEQPTRPRSSRGRGKLAIFLLVLKATYYMRVVERYGSLIIMIVEICKCVWPLVSLTMILLCAFSLAFTVALGRSSEEFRSPHLTLYRLVNTSMCTAWTTSSMTQGTMRWC